MRKRAGRAWFWIAVAAGVGGCTSSDPPGLTPPSELTGSWSGTIGDTALLNVSVTESPTPGGSLTGTAFVVSLSRVNILTLTGSGSVDQGYELLLTPAYSGTFQLRVVGTLGTAGFVGAYDLLVGSGSDLGLEADSGPVDFDVAPTGGISGRFFQGDWEPLGAKVALALGQNGTTVRGIVTWNDYDCLNEALLDGRLLGTRLQAQLSAPDAPDLPEGSVDLVWDPEGHTLRGSWAIATPALGGPCGTPSSGTASLNETAFGTSEASAEGGPHAVFVRVEAGQTSTEILYRR